MRTKQIPIALPDTIRAHFQQQADKLRIPLATYLRCKLAELYISETGTATPNAAVVPIGTASDDGPDLTDVW
jgi:hypothetical protein